MPNPTNGSHCSNPTIPPKTASCSSSSAGVLRKPVALSASLLLRMNIAQGQRKRWGLGSSPWAAGQYRSAQNLFYWRAAAPPGSCTVFPKINVKMTSFAIFCFLEHTFLSERQGEGCYTTAEGTMPWVSCSGFNSWSWFPCSPMMTGAGSALRPWIQRGGDERGRRKKARERGGHVMLLSNSCY